MPNPPSPNTVEELLAQAAWLRRLARTLVAGEAAAEDLVQETWLAALRHPARESGAARPWLARIARNLAANFRRGEARRREREGRVPARDRVGLDPCAVVEEVEAQRILAEAILRLEEPLRTTLVLRHLRGLDSRAIGRLQRVPAGTVRWRLKRGLELLRADLDRRFGGRRAWCAALSALARRAGPGAKDALGGLPAAGTLPVLAVAGVLVALGAWWKLSGNGARLPSGAAATASQEHVVDRGRPELEPAPRIEGLAGTSRSAPLAAEPATPRAARPAAERGRAPIRGQLRVARSGEALDETLDLRLRTGDLSVRDAVRSHADGSFASERSFPRGIVLVDVHRPAGDLAAECEVYFDPAAGEPCAVDVPWPNFARGRLVDRGGRPLRELEVRLYQGRGERGRERVSPSADGALYATGLEPGPLTIELRRGFERHSFSTTVTRGPNELGDVVVPFRERVGRIKGRLRSEHGEVGGVLVLTELASGIEHRTEAAGGARISEFEFEPVPLADYRLTLLAYDGQSYALTTRFVRPPADVEFVATGRSEPLDFRGRDGTDPVECEAWVRLAGIWSATDVACEPADVERWILVAEDHRPVAGRSLASARFEARFERGWGCALFFRESSGGAVPELKGPIAGVEVRADGVLVARSDADGVAILSLPARPTRLSYALAGWRAVHGDELGPENLSDFRLLERE